jgi:hypothetical protein
MQPRDLLRKTKPTVSLASWLAGLLQLPPTKRLTQLRAGLEEVAACLGYTLTCFSRDLPVMICTFAAAVSLSLKKTRLARFLAVAACQCLKRVWKNSHLIANVMFVEEFSVDRKEFDLLN